MISDNMILTSFLHSDEYGSKAFRTFKENRITIAHRLAHQRGINLNDPNNIDADGFPKGLGKNNQAVLMPAFYAAYTGVVPRMSPWMLSSVFLSQGGISVIQG